MKKASGNPSRAQAAVVPSDSTRERSRVLTYRAEPNAA
jgi:hypothetical protein